MQLKFNRQKGGGTVKLISVGRLNFVYANTAMRWNLNGMDGQNFAYDSRMKRQTQRCG